MPEYQKDLPSAQKGRVSYDIPRDLWEAVWRLAAATMRTQTEIYDEILCAQLQAWFDARVECEDPATGRRWFKEAGDPFPTRTGRFPRNAEGAGDRGGDVMRVTVRTDPKMISDWKDAVWQQLHVYSFPAFAFREAVESYVKQNS